MKIQRVVPVLGQGPARSIYELANNRPQTGAAMSPFAQSARETFFARRKKLGQKSEAQSCADTPYNKYIST